MVARRSAFSLAAVLTVCAPTFTSAAAGTDRTLGIEARVAAQEAIERVYYSHQIGSSQSFEQTVPREVLEQKVRTYLAQSAALEKFWGTPVTAAMLHAEALRIARDTRFPDRLRQVYRALGDDPFLVEECLARPALVDRLARNFFAYDRGIHAAARSEAEDLRRLLATRELDPAAGHPRRRETELRRMPSAAEARSVAAPPGDREERALLRTESEFRRERALAPAEISAIGEPREEREAFVVRVLLAESADALRIADYAVPKTSWDAWWTEVRPSLDDSAVEPSSSSAGPPPEPGSRRLGAAAARPAATEGAAATSICVPDDTWDNAGFDEAIVPTPRYGHTSVWTGSLMIVWGGSETFGATDSGARYDPLTDTWSPTSVAGAPSGRFRHSAVWTGTEMIVWGGEAAAEAYWTNSGGRYNPSSDSWITTTTAGAPAGRKAHAAVWTGSRMIVWGGYGFDIELTGGSYDPANDSWVATSTVGTPTARWAHTAVWTGSRVIIWGGYEESGDASDTGGRYDPATNTWAPTSLVASASARASHSAVWTGSEMIVWGGDPIYSSATDTGARYNPTTDTWVATSTVGAPLARASHAAAWTGSRMIVWGGSLGSPSYYLTNTGGRYDPATNTWVPLSTAAAPLARASHTAVWTGSRMIVWGGNLSASSYHRTNTGGRYDPATDSWTPTSIDGPPFPRSVPGVWTGDLMIVWGSSSPATDTGGRYDPLLDAWTPTSLVGAPSPTGRHTAVWTGRQMIVWDGGGGRYEPISDTWMPLSPVGAPTTRRYHEAVWSGGRMVVWGGVALSDEWTRTGGRYNPETDSWQPTSLLDAPLARKDFAAVSTGSRMLVWGGDDGTRGTETGGLYDPASDTWTPTTLVGAPGGRRYHTMVWTGSRALVWGGLGVPYPYPALDTGGAYDPATNSWTPLSTANAPAARYDHTAVWTGSRMIVWGGHADSGGGRYDPATDSWLTLSPVDEPPWRYGHAAVWTGSHMLVWGGLGDRVYNTGGRYAVGHADDLDEDGYSLCAGDCDDADATRHPGAAETCDGKDQDCDGLVPPGESDLDADGALACLDCDDSDPLRFPGNAEPCDAVDNDCDGISNGHPTACGVGACAAAGVCSGGVDSCVPGAAGSEICNGLDDDCNGLLPAAEADLDGDGWSACGGDCDDAYFHTFPDAGERNDARDNQCSGDPGDGLVDELEGAVGFPNASNPNRLCWPGQYPAWEYEVARSGSPAFPGGCERTRVDATCLDDPDVPASRTVLYYVVRPIAPHAGSYGSGSSGVERAGVCAVEVDCDDGIDNDGDGHADCADPACFGHDGCRWVELDLADLAGDGIPTTAIETFFSKLTAIPTDHIKFWVHEDGLPNFMWCSERADFYREQYLGLAVTAGVAVSGAWSRWHREFPPNYFDVPWQGPFTSGNENWYGDDCVGPYSWCSEVGLGGRIPGVAPAETGICEVFENLTCGGPASRITISVGDNFAWACGG